MGSEDDDNDKKKKNEATSITTETAIITVTKEATTSAAATLIKWPMSKVRSTFINFFVNQYNHTYWKSSPCVPIDDPTLLFTNAGMNQFKPLFLGTIDPTLGMSKLKRAVNTQKCIRAGGKHNDLDDVGKDVYHHTFFEMLGNWSFGDYFKRDAINMAWECLTKEFELDKQRLYATYFGGDETTPADHEARDIWLQHLPSERVLPFDAKDNFWEMGTTGPCGPCTEIHYDRIGNRDAASLVNMDDPSCIEIWNNVFIQFNREMDGSLRPLPQQHVDTGMGFERLTSILQDKQSNYDTDIFQPLFKAIQNVTSTSNNPTPPYGGKVGIDDAPNYIDTAYRIVADHIRTLSFAIADGAIPSNDGRGYVLRRVLRRAVRYGRQNLQCNEFGFFAKLVPTVVDVMGDAFPELRDKQDHVTKIIQDEEESFSRTLDKGLQKFNDLVAKVVEGNDDSSSGVKKNNKVFSGIDAHHLYTTWGFPVDLTELMAEERGLTLNRIEFDNKMQEEQELSAEAHRIKTSTDSGGKDMRFVAEQTSYLSNTIQLMGTNDDEKYTWDKPCENCIIKALFVGRNETEDKIGFVNTISVNDGAIGIVLDKTSFYAEAGGQIYDTGYIRLMKSSTTTTTTSDGSSSSSAAEKIRIHNVQMYGQYVLHVGTVVGGNNNNNITASSFSVGDVVTCYVDYDRRRPIAANHTMTHMLNHALRDVLIKQPANQAGDETTRTTTTPTSSIDQKGSLVDDKKLRFDFSWNDGSLSVQQLDSIERHCCRCIDTGIPVEAYVAPLNDAMKISSLRAVFGEKYPDPVRVIAVADDNHSISDMIANPQDDVWNQYSVEFCGGTHLNNTKDAKAFVLLSEEGIAKGIRRIVAVTTDEAQKAIVAADSFQTQLDVISKSSCKGDELEAKIKVLTVELNALSISAVRKHQFRITLADLTKQVMAYKKQRLNEMVSEISQKAIDMATTTTSTTSSSSSCSSDRVIMRYDFGLDGKISKTITQAYLKKVKDKPFMLITADENVDRFMMIAVAPKGGCIHVDCKEWILSSLKDVGIEGKGGGKKDSAQYQVQGSVQHITKVIEQAQTYTFQ